MRIADFGCMVIVLDLGEKHTTVMVVKRVKKNYKEYEDAEDKS